MAVPDPATTNWVPIWNPMGAGPAGPQGPIGPIGPQGPPGPTGAASVWVDEPYNAANFSASAGMVWTVDAGDVSAYTYSIIDHTMMFAFNFQNTSITGTIGPSVTFKIPGGKVSAKTLEFICGVVSNGVQGVARVFLFAGNDTVFCNHPSSAWPLSTDATVVAGQINFPIL